MKLDFEFLNDTAGNSKEDLAWKFDVAPLNCLGFFPSFNICEDF